MADAVVRKWLNHDEHVFIPGILQNQTASEATFKLEDGSTINVPTAKLETLDPVHEAQLEGVDDICALPKVTASALLYSVRVRYAKKLIYTRLHRILICLNPFESLPIYSSQYLDQYASAADSMDYPPHIFAIGADAMKGMNVTSKDQAVVISGESGAGKTESCKLIMSYVTEAGSSGSGGGLDEKVLQTNPVLEAFGNAMTVRNNNSSRFGKWMDMKFSSSSTSDLLGCHITHYLLETTRVTSQADGERSYHIFFQLLEARNEPEFKDLQVQPKEHYEYLKGSLPHAPGVDDAKCFDETRAAFSMLGFTADDQTEILKLVLSVLTLGNISFKEKGNEEIELADDAAMKTICALLQVDSKDLTRTLLFRKLYVGKDVTEAALKIDQAKSVRDSLSKQLYGLLFAWLIERINNALKLQTGDSASVRLLGILDIAGFESFAVNSLEQLCINLANEHLQQQFNTFVFKSEMEEFAKEGLSEMVDQINYADNADVLALIDGKGGVLDLLDEELTVPKATDETYSNKVSKTHAKNARFVASKFARDAKFGISHYAGIVTYSCDGFLEKNADKPPDDSMEVIATSKLQLLKTLAAMNAENQKESSAGPAGKKKKQTGTSKFRVSLRSLIQKINNAQPHFVRCIKPNKEKVPSVFTSAMVMDQLILSGSLEAVKVLQQQSFSYRVVYKAFVMRYACLDKPWNKVKGEPGMADVKALVERLCAIVQPPIVAKDFLFGNTKIFVKTSASSTLDSLRAKVVVKKAIRIQSLVRGRKVRKAMAHAKAVFAELRSWLTQFCPDALNPPPMTTACIAKFSSLKVAEEELANLRSCIFKVKALPYRTDVVKSADLAEKSLFNEIEACKQMKEILQSGSLDPVNMDKCVARARGLNLSFCEDFKALEVRAERLRAQLPLVKAMKMVLLDSDKSALDDIVSEVKKVGLDSGTDWLPELDGASFYERIMEEVKRIAEAKAKADAEAKAKANFEALKAKAAADAQAKADAVAKAKAKAEGGGAVSLPPPPPEAKSEAPPTVDNNAEQPPAEQPPTIIPRDRASAQRKTITGLGAAQQAVILHELEEAADEYDVELMEKLLTDAVLEGISKKDLEPAKKVFEQLQNDAFLLQAVEDAKKEVEKQKAEEDESNIDLVACRRLLNLSAQIRKLQGDENVASSAVQKVQAVAVQQAKADRKKSVFEMENADELLLVEEAFKNLCNFQELKSPKDWKGHKGFVMTSFENSEKDNMLLHSKLIIAESLCDLEEEFDAIAIQNFRNIMIWMGDKTVQECQRMASRHDIIHLAGTNKDMTDEVYVQVMKQLTCNPSSRSASMGWQLLLALCQEAPPTDDLIEFVRYFVKSNSSDEFQASADADRFLLEATQSAKDCLKVLNGESLGGEAKLTCGCRARIRGLSASVSYNGKQVELLEELAPNKWRVKLTDDTKEPLHVRVENLECFEIISRNPTGDLDGEGELLAGDMPKTSVIAGAEQGKWQYICVDPKGVNTRSSPVYVKQGGTGTRLAFGDMVEISERGKVENILWLKLADDSGWVFEKAAKTQRMSEVCYVEVDDFLEEGGVIIRPDITTGIKLMDAPYVSEKGEFTYLHPGTPIGVQAKANITTQDGLKSFWKVFDDVNNEGWIPAEHKGKRTLSRFTVEPLKMEESDSLWIAVCAGKRPPIYVAPGRSTHPYGFMEQCQVLEVAPERLVSESYVFYRLTAGGWFCETNADGKVPFEWVEREPHWWLYTVNSKTKGSVEIQQYPTRDKRYNTSKLDAGQEVKVSEKVTFMNGDCFVHLEKPLDGWVSVLDAKGEANLTQLTQIPEGEARAKELPACFAEGQSEAKAPTKASKGFGFKFGK